MTTALTMPHYGSPCPDNLTRIFRPSHPPLVMADRLMQEAAGMFGRTFGKRGAKSLAPFVSPQHVSHLRRRGGCLGEVSVLMVADPANALAYAEHLMAVARSVTLTHARPLSVVLSEEARADAAEDVAQDDLRVAVTSETLANYIAAAVKARAALTESIDCARARKAELEAGR